MPEVPRLEIQENYQAETKEERNKQDKYLAWYDEVLFFHNHWEIILGSTVVIVSIHRKDALRKGGNN